MCTILIQEQTQDKVILNPTSTQFLPFSNKYFALADYIPVFSAL